MKSVRERRGITADTALRLARYFGGDPQTWLTLQMTYDLKIAERDPGRDIEKTIEPREAAHA